MKTLSLSYEDWVRGELAEGDYVLDAGCGGGEFGVVKELLESALHLVGVDIDEGSLRGNDKYDSLACGTVERLPFKGDIFHLIVSRFVFEHLKDPHLALNEMARVLKEGGSIVILTQNIWNPLMCMSYLLPLGVRKWITRTVFRSEEDEGRYETYYRCNSRKRFKSMEERNPELKMEVFHRYNTSTLHLWKNPLLRAVFAAVERVLSLRLFSLFRPSLLVRYRKEGSARSREERPTRSMEGSGV